MERRGCHTRPFMSAAMLTSAKRATAKLTLVLLLGDCSGLLDRLVTGGRSAWRHYSVCDCNAALFFFFFFSHSTDHYKGKVDDEWGISP